MIMVTRERCFRSYYEKVYRSMCLITLISSFCRYPSWLSGADNQRVFVNGETGAAFSIMVQANEEGATAKDIAAAGAQELGCKGEVEGDETFAGASACDVNGQTLDYAVIVGDGKMVVFYANDKVTQDEVTAFTTWILSDEE